MFSLLQRELLRFFRVPPEPSTPRGEGDVRVFRAARRFYTWRKVKWGGTQLAVLTGSILGNLANGINIWSGFTFWNRDFIGIFWTLFLLQLFFTYALLRLDYEQRWYILTDRSLRIREGVLRLNEKTMTFANIQHLTVKQGPLQRLLGISDLEVRTAGGGGGTSGAQPGKGRAAASTHIACFRGVDNAEEIRTLIRDRIRLYRDSGLGDPDDKPAAPARAAAAGPTSSDHHAEALLSAARELGREARALREVVEGRESGHLA
jgi:membrane protein YdbS with pleckstrin-like domain